MFLISVPSRDERRWIEKQNRAARALRKKEEMNRIRTLVGKHELLFKRSQFVVFQSPNILFFFSKILHTAVIPELRNSRKKKRQRRKQKRKQS